MKKQFAVHIDFKASSAYDHRILEADNLLDAMSEAEYYLTEGVYLITISEKVKTLGLSKMFKESLHTELLTNRGNGWHRTDEAHGERPCGWRVTEYRERFAPDWDMWVD